MNAPTVMATQTLPRIQRCDATVGKAAAAFGFTPVICSQAVGVRTFVTTTGLRVGYCALDGHEASVRRRFAERPAPIRRIRVADCASCSRSDGPPHDASPRCASGRREHCSCDGCF